MSIFFCIVMQTMATVIGVSFLKRHLNLYPIEFSIQGMQLLLASRWVWGSGVAYACSLFLFVWVLSRTPLTVMVPVQIGCALLWSVFSGVCFFNESINAMKLIGMILLMGGVLCVSR